MENEEAFPEMAVMLAEPRNQLLQLVTAETYSFRDEGDQVVNGFRNLEGRMVDEHTFEGVMRIDYESIRKDLRKYNEAVDEWDNGEYEAANDKGEPYVEISDDLIEEYEVPGSFQMQFEIHSIRIYTEEEKYIVRGSWIIPATLEIRQSTKDTATIWVNETNEYGRDISVITVYVCDDSIDLINQAAYLPNGTLDEELYAELLEEKAQYKKLIDATQYLEE